jgi:hypothetical protein
MCKPLNKVHEWIFICFNWTRYEKIIYVKVWFIKQSCAIGIYPIFYIFYHKTKWQLDGKDNAMYIWRPILKPCYQQPYMDYMLTPYHYYKNVGVVHWSPFNRPVNSLLLHWSSFTN